MPTLVHMSGRRGPIDDLKRLVGRVAVSGPGRLGRFQAGLGRTQTTAKEEHWPAGCQLPGLLLLAAGSIGWRLERVPAGSTWSSATSWSAEHRDQRGATHATRSSSPPLLLDCIGILLSRGATWCWVRDGEDDSAGDAKAPQEEAAARKQSAGDVERASIWLRLQRRLQPDPGPGHADLLAGEADCRIPARRLYSQHRARHGDRLCPARLEHGGATT